MSTNLGRGLSSLIPNKALQSAASVGMLDDHEANGYAVEIPIDKIIVNSLQPRKQFNDISLEELENSIKEFGIIQPLIICPKKGDTYELIAGERRLRAAKKAGLLKVPVIIRTVNDQEKLEVALIENIQRENLNSIDLATAYRKLMDDFRLTQESVAKKIGKSRSVVANTLRLLSLPEEIRLAIMDQKISEGHAKYLTGLDSEAKQMALFRKILHNDMSVSDTDSEAKRMGGTKQARVKINYADKDKEFALREFFGAKVEIVRKGKGGQIVIAFYSEDELAELVDKIKG